MGLHKQPKRLFYCRFLGDSAAPTHCLTHESIIDFDIGTHVYELYDHVYLPTTARSHCRAL
jgi:hypothetical protein